jgi:hypothetical protein
MPAQRAPASFVIAGSGESVEGKANYRDHIVSLGRRQSSRHAGEGKVGAGRNGAPVSAFGGDWKQTAGVQLYAVQDVFPILENELGRRGVFRNGLTWHFNRPPVVGLEYEMDCRCVQIERVV